jgi:hypothetical protein
MPQQKNQTGFASDVAQSSRQFLKKFVLDVMEEVGLGDLGEETKKKFVGQFISQAEQRIGMKLLPKLDEDEREELSDMIRNSSSDPQAMHDFWNSKLDNYGELVQEALDDFRLEMKEEMEKIKDQG